MLCREFMGNAPNSLAYTAVAYSMLVRKVFAIVAATERGNFQALDAVQMIREGVLGLYSAFFLFTPSVILHVQYCGLNQLNIGGPLIYKKALQVNSENPIAGRP